MCAISSEAACPARHAGKMRLPELVQRLWRRSEFLPGPVCAARAFWWRLRGARIGRGTRLPSAQVTWPHQIQIGRDCRLQSDIFFNFDHYWTPGPSILLGDRVFVGRGVEFNIQGRIEIGDDVLIASGCVFVDHDHGTAVEVEIARQSTIVRPIVVAAGAWIGARAVVLKGVTIGAGAVVGAGSVVTKSIPPGEIWGGVPSRRISVRVAASASDE